MPQAPKTLCRCGGVITDGACNRCGPRRARVRTTEERPHNNVRWQKFSRQFLDDHPLCDDCLEAGRTTMSTQTHHLAKARPHPELMFEESNCRALCEGCHSVRTRKGE